MAWIAFILAVQLGWIPQGGVTMYNPPEFLDASNTFYQAFEAKVVLFKTVEIGGSATVHDWITKTADGFWPDRLDSIFFLGLLLGPVTVEWRHRCIHAVIPFQDAYKEAPGWDAGTDQVFVRVELKWGG